VKRAILGLLALVAVGACSNRDSLTEPKSDTIVQGQGDAPVIHASPTPTPFSGYWPEPTHPPVTPTIIPNPSPQPCENVAGGPCFFPTVTP
jgi:hypothetical protein